MKFIYAMTLFACLIPQAYASDDCDGCLDMILHLNKSINKAVVRIQNLENMSQIVDSSLSVLTNKTQQLQQNIDELKKKQSIRHHLGEEYRGGLIFYVDESGQHGLIASKVDVNQQGVQWRNGASGNKVTNARGDGIGAGETNTRVIISQQTIDNQKGTFAALQAANFQVLSDGVTPCKTPVLAEEVCYGGWYLPSAYELQLLHKNLHLNNFSAFAPEFYWSSTEHNVSEAWLMQFASGELISSNKSSTTGRVRAVSKF